MIISDDVKTCFTLYSKLAFKFVNALILQWKAPLANPFITFYLKIFQ